MRRIAIMLLSVAATLVATSELATARDGCGNGWYWNGYRCAPMGRTYYAPQYFGYYRPPGTATQVNPWGATCYRGRCCPAGYSIQDGVCKPYRGY